MRWALLAALAFGACRQQAPPAPPAAQERAVVSPTPGKGPGRQGSCTADADCHATGCSETVCASGPPTFSTCEFRQEYGCYRSPTTSCGCFDGACSWKPTEELKKCLAGSMEGEQP